MEWELSAEASGTWSKAARTLPADSDYEEVWRCALTLSTHTIYRALTTASFTAFAHAWLHSTSTGAIFNEQRCPVTVWRNLVLTQSI